MSAVLLGNEPYDTPAWHALRAGGIGSSEIAAVIGLSPFCSAYTLWQRQAGNLGPQEKTEEMEWGQLLEPVVCARFAAKHPEYRLVEAGTYAHAERDWQRANPDRLLFDAHAGSDAPVSYLEAKTADAHTDHEWGDSGTDQVPPGYRAQVIWQGDVLGFTRAHAAVLIGGNRYREYVLTWDEDEAAWLREQGRVFWQSVLDGQPPTIDGSDSTYEAVRQLHPDIAADTETEVDPIAFEGWESAVAEVKRLTTELQRNRSLVADQMGDARYGTVLGDRVVIRQSTKGGTPYPKLIPQRKAAAA